MNATADLRLTYGILRPMVIEALGNTARFMRIGGLGSLVLTILASLVKGFGEQSVMLLFAGVVLLGFPDLIAALAWRQQRKLPDGPTAYQINSGGVVIRSPAGRTEVNWPSISRIRTGKHGWYFRHGGVQLPVPRRAFDPDEQRAIDDFLAARVSS